MLRAFPLRGTVIESGPDDALVAAARVDPAAFEAIYERYLPRVYRYLAARATNPEEAADLTHAAFLKALDGLHGYKSKSTPFASWLFRIARNTAVDAHRRKRPTVPWEFVPEFHAQGGEPPDEAILRTERLRELRAAVAQLEPDKRDLLALRYAGGLTAAEIAPLVGKSPEAVKKQLQRTLQQLKEHHRD